MGWRCRRRWRCGAAPCCGRCCWQARHCSWRRASGGGCWRRCWLARLCWMLCPGCTSACRDGGGRSLSPRAGPPILDAPACPLNIAAVNGTELTFVIDIQQPPGQAVKTGCLGSGLPGRLTAARARRSQIPRRLCGLQQAGEPGRVGRPGQRNRSRRTCKAGLSRAGPGSISRRRAGLAVLPSTAPVHKPPSSVPDSSWPQAPRG